MQETPNGIRVYGNIKPEDDYTHPLGPESNFNESVYFNFFDPSQNRGGFVSHWDHGLCRDVLAWCSTVWGHFTDLPGTRYSIEMTVSSTWNLCDSTNPMLVLNDPTNCIRQVWKAS